MPIISVIVPIYNTHLYLTRCVDSILNQTFKDIEIILVNDGSTDISGAICDEYALSDNRIRVIHKENGGLSSARNAGIDLAVGKYIAFVDSDDYIEHDMYEHLLFACEKHKVPMAVCGRYVHEGTDIKSVFVLDGGLRLSSAEAIEKLLTWDSLDSSACDKLFLRDLFNSFRFPVGKYNEDIFVMTRIIDWAKELYHIGTPKYHYVYRPGSITQEAFNVRKMDLLAATEQVLRYVQAHYPTLEDKAIFFHIKSILYLYPLLLRDKRRRAFGLYEAKLRSMLKQYFLLILFSKYISKKEKMVAFLLLTRSYTAARYCYLKIRERGGSDE